MLDLITLNVVEKIFEIEKGLSSMSKSLYTNCLIKHFKGKDAVAENATSFEIKINGIPQFHKWQKYFLELKNVGIVTITQNAIVFENKWGQLIDRQKLGVSNVGPNAMNSAINFEEGLKANQSMVDVIGMKNKLTKNQILGLIRIFVLEQDATETLYKDLGEISKHFIYWVNTNKNNIDLSIDTVRSNAKILGL